MGLPVLYSFRRCPYAMRARLAICYAGVSVALREVVLKNKPEPLLLLSSKATVPVLQLSCGTIIDESLDIMHWALSVKDEDHWLAVAEEDHSLISACDNDFKYWLDRYKYADRYLEHSQQYYREQCLRYISQLEIRLVEHQFLAGMKMTLLDAAIFPFIRQFAHVDKGWFFSTQWVNVQRWLTMQLDSELFGAVMMKNSPWQADDPVLLFPSR